MQDAGELKTPHHPLTAKPCTVTMLKRQRAK